MTLSEGTQIGPYTVSGLIGQGGMGEVYQARDTKFDRDVALDRDIAFERDQGVRRCCPRRSPPTPTGWPASSGKRAGKSSREADGSGRGRLTGRQQCCGPVLGLGGVLELLRALYLPVPIPDDGCLGSPLPHHAVDHRAILQPDPPDGSGRGHGARCCTMPAAPGAPGNAVRSPRG